MHLYMYKNLGIASRPARCLRLQHLYLLFKEHLYLLFKERLDLLQRQRPLGPVDPSFRALSGRLKFWSDVICSIKILSVVV